MPITQVLLIVLCSICFLLLVALGISFSISRKSQKVMESLLTILTQPERAQIADASRVLGVILADNVAKINADFHAIQETLKHQIEVAQDLHEKLSTQNDELVNTADDATKKVANMSQRLENTVGGLQSIVESTSWQNVEGAADKFTANLDDVLAKIDNTTTDVDNRVTNLQNQMTTWIESGHALNEELDTNFERNTEHMKSLNDETNTMRDNLGELNKSVADGFDNIKTSAAGYEETLRSNDKFMNDH